MMSIKLSVMLFGLCWVLDSVQAKNTSTTDTKSTQAVHISTSTATSSSDDALCSSYVSKVPGSLLRQSETALLNCRCSRIISSDQQICPEFNFVEGDENIFVEERRLDLSADTCNLEYKLKIRSGIQVGKERVIFTCSLPNSGEVLGVLDVYIDTPSPRARLSVYMILAIVCFLLLTIALFGFLLRWKVSRRRAQRSALYRTPFAQPQTNYPGTGAVNPNFNVDNPPSYNEATLAKFQAKVGVIKTNECPEKQPKPENKEQDTKREAS